MKVCPNDGSKMVTYCNLPKFKLTMRQHHSIRLDLIIADKFLVSISCAK
jgi:hypothetical protein